MENLSSPLISVVVPCYNVEKYLPRCIDSILSQTYRNLEILLVDDGSPDDSGKLCDEYGIKDNRVKVIHKINGGLSDARNVAIDVATGEYITFIDSDDYVSPEYVKTLYGLVFRYSCMVSVVLPQTFFEGEDVRVCKYPYVETLLEPIQAVEEMFYQEKFDTSAWGKLYHRSLFATGIRYPKGILFEDMPTTFQLLFRTDKVAYCNKQLYYYLLRADSIEGSAFSEQKMTCALKVFDLMSEHEELLCKVKRAYRCRMISFSFHLLLKMPNDYKQKNILYDFIRANRLNVLLDSRARKKARVACLVSYLGINILKRVFAIVDSRNR